MKKIRTKYILAVFFLILFAALTYGLQNVDVQTYAATDSPIGFASVNIGVHEYLDSVLSQYRGEDGLFYKITKLLGYIAIATAPCFALLALSEMIRKGGLRGVDGDLWALLGHYVLLAACYVAFEKYIVNYRPILVDGALEASYPSSHTMLTVAMFGAAMVQMKKRIRIRPLRAVVRFVFGLAIAAMAVGRLLSGVHWLTDIIGALLIGFALVSLYDAVFMQIRRVQKRKAKARKRSKK